jgi:hypothetical protein
VTITDPNKKATVIFFTMGLDSPNQIELVQEIKPFAHEISPGGWGIVLLSRDNFALGPGSRRTGTGRAIQGET